VPLGGENGHGATYLGNVLDITQRKVAEEALLATEQRFRSLTSCSPVGIFMSDHTGALVYANARLQAICGYTLPEVQGLAFAKIYLAEDREAALTNWVRLANSTEPHSLERRVIRRDGEMRWIHVRSAPLIAANGSVMGRVGTVEDITDRRQAESQLRRSEERYRILAEHATDLISKHAPDGTYLYASPACRDLLGYEPEELVGRSPLEFFHPDELATICQSHPSFGQHGTIDVMSYRMRRRDGAYVWFETISRTIPDPSHSGGEEIIAVSRDITARRQAADRLRANEARMRGILDTAIDGIITVDESGRIELFNRGAEQLFGYSADEVLGKPIRMLLPDDCACAASDHVWSAAQFRQKIADSKEVLGRRKDGTLCELEMRAGETVVDGRSIFTGIVHDVSQRKRTEKLLRENEKFAAAGRIAARVAHEINNPLAGIMNSFLLIKDAIPRNHAYFGYVARIENEITRIARIVRQMFDLYRPSRISVCEVDVGETIRDVVALVGTIAPGRQVKIEVRADAEVARVRLPEDPVRQVLYNIIVNAIEASPVGGQVLVQASRVGDQLCVEVFDHGEGISPEVRAQIYEPFFTTKNETPGAGGLGLGLPISRSIIEALGGTLDFESSPRDGTVFRILTPIGEQSDR
jgi:two-component system, NtrC family, sensor kinase